MRSLELDVCVFFAPPPHHITSAPFVTPFAPASHYVPGRACFAVYHVPFFDASSRCSCLSDCLASVAAWSRAHPNHSLLTLIIEPKYRFDWRNPYAGGDTAALIALQAAIRQALPRGSILSPSAVQGGAASLGAAVLSRGGGGRGGLCGWPSADETRGAFMLLLDTWRENADAAASHRALPPAERLFFLRASGGEPQRDAVFVETGPSGCPMPRQRVSDAIAAQMPRLRAVAASGAYVRMSVDAGGGCWAGDAEGFARAVVASGAQLLASNGINPALLHGPLEK